MKYAIEVKETLSRIIIVEAENANEAEDKVRNAYQNDKIILDCDDFIGVEFIDNSNEYSQKDMDIFEFLDED